MHELVPLSDQLCLIHTRICAGDLAPIYAYMKNEQVSKGQGYEVHQIGSGVRTRSSSLFSVISFPVFRTDHASRGHTSMYLGRDYLIIGPTLRLTAAHHFAYSEARQARQDVSVTALVLLV